MAKQGNSTVVGSITNWTGGIADADKLGQENSFAFGAAVDFRSDPRKLTLLPRALKDSGSVVTDLPLWGERCCASTYFYGNTGNIYKRTNTTGAWSLAHTAPSAAGNGLAYFGEDDNLYYAQNTTIGRYTQACSEAGSWVDDYLLASGGAPTNTRSLSLASASSQYAFKADNAALSLTGDISLETYAKPTTLPTGSEITTLMGKWNENGNQRSYKMDITTQSNFFGDGSDGALTISVNTTDAPIDSTAVGTSGAYSLTATNASFAAGQKIFIHQSQGTNAGQWMLNSIASYTAGTITLSTPLNGNYASSGGNKAQVLVFKQYTTVTVNPSIVWTGKAWNATNGKGGIFGFFANSTVTISGNITQANNGFVGGNTSPSPDGSGSANGVCWAGESSVGPSIQTHSANGSGGGGGRREDFLNGASGGGGGGANGVAGTNGGYRGTSSYLGIGGAVVGTADLTTMTFGGGGGGGSNTFSSPSTYPNGGAGGGIICLFGVTITGSGNVIANGQTGNTGTSAGAERAGAGGGGGGSILLKAQVYTGTSLTVNALGGNAGGGTDANGGAGGAGRIHLDYLTSYTGTTNPTLDVAQDPTLGSGTGYILRLGISSNGTNSEFLTQNITTKIDTTSWHRWTITWSALSHLASFYQDGNLLGTANGTLTSIFDSTADFAVGANKNSAGSYANFYNGLLDDLRVWNAVRTASQVSSNLNKVLTGFEANLIAYFQFESNLTDSQSSALNSMTGVNTPTYSLDVPFSGLTSRNDLDKTNSGTVSGQTYTLATSISEAATAKISFVPAKDPQKSIILNISAKGTGNWTVTIHNALNQIVATSTVTSANLYTGFYEFTYASSFRPVIGATYHAHVTSTVADGIVVTGTINDLSTAYMTTYFQILVSDAYHPMTQFLNYLVIGNERYLSTIEGGDIHTPMKLSLPATYRIRCFAKWHEYLAIGVWRGSSITDYDEGKIFFWDGTSLSYNFYIDVPEGGINAMFVNKGVLYVVAGYQGRLLAFRGLYGDQIQKIHKVPKLVQGNYVEVAPGGMAVWQSLLHFGVALNSDSSDIERGVYTWGSLNQKYPDALGFDYPLSLGRQTNTGVKTGALVASGGSLFVGWQNGVAFGVDKINIANPPSPTGTIEQLITDLGTIPQEKLPVLGRVDCLALASGESVQIKYKIDREGMWNAATIQSAADARYERIRIPKMAREVQIGCDLATTATTSPAIVGMSLEVALEGPKRNA